MSKLNTDELLQFNNEKRKQLSNENLRYYEDMIIYIRLADDKSEQETEEILAELLDHLILAQQEGKTPAQVFGDNPKKFADEIIGELPKLITKKRTLAFTMAILYFLAASAFFSGLFNIISSYLLHIGEPTKEIYVGSFIVKTIISIPIAIFLLYFIISYLRWLCFRNINKVIELFSYGLYGIVSTGIFLLVLFIIPDFGSVITVPVYMVVLIGILLYFAAHVTRKAL